MHAESGHEQREEARNKFKMLHGVSQVLNLFMMAGVWFISGA
jgi:hypothetical protein